MRFAVILPLLAGLCPLCAAAPAPTREELMVQTQAADMLGEAISGAVEQAEKGAGAPAPTTRPATRPAAPSYRELFDQTVARLKKGEIPEDASLNNLDTNQLFGEMTALQVYNLQQYARLTHALVAATATMPTLQMLLAQPKDPTWSKKRQQMRNAVAYRLYSARTRANESAAQTPSVPAAAPMNPGTYDDPRWHPYFYGPTDALTGWSDPFADPFLFQSGGGLYQRYDTRVNRDYDPRVNGDFDRRVNIDYDRRTNIHIDPRQNY